jgi:DNA-binding transcriptional MerR regulator
MQATTRGHAARLQRERGVTAMMIGMAGRDDEQPPADGERPPGTPGAGAEAGAGSNGSAGSGDGADEVEYTIDELAAITGVPSRTIRFYQSKGTLPSPRRRGRVALYGPDHVERLKVIAELQDRGLRLDAIRDVLNQIEWGGDSLQSWLGVGERLQTPWTDERPMMLTRDELLARFEGGRPGLIADLERSGIIRRETDAMPASYLVPSPGLLDIGFRLEKAGIDVDTALGAAALMRKYVSRLSDDLVSYFADRAGKGFGRDGAPEDVVMAYDAVRPIGFDALRIIFAQEIERSLREFVESGRAVMTRAGRDPGRGSSKRKQSKPTRPSKPTKPAKPSRPRPAR